MIASGAASLTTRRTLSLLSRRSWTCPACLQQQQQQQQQQHHQRHRQQRHGRPYSQASKASKASKPDEQPESKVEREPPDHRKIGLQQELFITSAYSPGSPIFLPNGTRIFNRLVDFLRKQYVRYGFQEVLTPTMYKKSLWAKSGHLQNYADDMYSVTATTPKEGGKRPQDGIKEEEKDEEEEEDDDDFGLKPMNCPGHCLIFASKRRSYRELPIRYADFSPLHRNEVSGALTGLTRVRRFHQDDGHIFCRPSQVEDEVARTLSFVRAVYGVLRLGVGYRLVLSTRPREHYMGTEAEWARAEASLTRALDASGLAWAVNEGDGAFYGPKIDIAVRDAEGREHQTATVQLDFQLPKRFELEYLAPAPELEARGEATSDPALLARYGPVRPVMIHRAVLGSVERLMALLAESYGGKWPFWLSPRQAVVLTVTTSERVVRWAEDVRDVLVGNKRPLETQEGGVSLEDTLAGQTGLAVDVDATARSLGAKIREARASGYGMVLVVGEHDVAEGRVSLGKERMTPAELRDRMLSMVDRCE